MAKSITESASDNFCIIISRNEVNYSTLETLNEKLNRTMSDICNENLPIYIYIYGEEEEDSHFS